MQGFIRLLNNRETTYSKILKENHISKNTFKKRLEKYGLSMPDLDPGRPHKQMENQEEVKLKIINYRNKFNVGYKTCCYALNLRFNEKLINTKLTEFDVRKIYFENNLFTSHKEKPPKRRISYVAEMANQIWHTDLHEIKVLVDNQVLVTQYIIAFIDDRTRFILYASQITNKQCHTVANELKKVLSSYLPPYQIETDNGGEFTGKDFESVLNEYGIIHYKTDPYSPQENGKIERWWQHYEKAKDNNMLYEIVHEYNNYWPCSALKKLYNKKTTPAQAWATDIHWNKSMDVQPQVIYNQ